MNATMNPSTTTSEPPTASDSHSCRRCGGFLMTERCLDLAESVGGYWFWASRCVQCGDLVDEVILCNRERPPQADEVDVIGPTSEQPIEQVA